MVALPPSQSTQPRYFSVSPAKFVVMSLASFGIYGFYWFYRNWVLERAHTNEDLSPFWRTFFAPLWIYSLLRRMRDAAGGAQVAPAWRAEISAVAYIVITCGLFLPDPYWLVSLLVVVPLVPVQRTVNALNAVVAPATSRNDAYSGKNLVLIIVGLIFYVLLILGMMAPAETDTLTTWVVA
jgi:hypothetical protein